METYELVKKILSDYGLVGFGVLVIIFILFNPEKVQIIAGWLWYPLGFLLKFAKRKKIQNLIEGHCSESLKKIAKELPDIEVPNLKITWIKDDDLQTLFKEKKAIVKLKFSSDETQNIIKATTVYVRDAFLKHSKPYLSGILKKSIDFSVTKKILLGTTKNTRNIVSQYIEENLEGLDEIKDRCSQIEEIDDNGLFTSVLLRELDFYGNQLVGKLPTNEHFQEADNFVNFIYDIAIREPDENTPLQFSDATLKIAVLLVAKKETYLNYGLAPYLRRIKLGLSRGINTFYLLAREDKVDILNDVAKELLETGNFILINKPKIFKDADNRDVIYYCIRINKDSFMVQATKNIADAIKNKDTVKGVITKVKNDCLKVDFDGVEGIVNKQNMSVIPIQEPYKYFRENYYVELLPLAILDNGVVEFSLKGTKSDPNHIITANYEIGQSIYAKVKYCDDSFIKLELNSKTIEGIAFRRNLTYSRFLLLNKKFPINSEHDFIICGHDFERNQIILKLKDLADPWQNNNLIKNSKVTFIPFKKAEKSIVGELSEGLEAILPYNEISWFPSQIDKEKGNIKIEKSIECVIRDISKEDKRIILSLKHKNNNPYITFFSANKDKKLRLFVQSINAYGISGVVQSQYEVFVPKHEQSWNGDPYKYQIGNTYDVCLKEISASANNLIGTFKPIIQHPLQKFAEHFKEGQVLKYLEIKNKYDWGCVLSINDGKKNYEGLLFNGEFSNSCFISSAKDVLKNTPNLPLIIKTIDFDKNKIILSLKALLKLNISRISNISYDSQYSGIMLGKKGFDYIVLLEGIWIEAIFETNRNYNIGEKVQVRPIRIGEEELIVSED